MFCRVNVNTKQVPIAVTWNGLADDTSWSAVYLKKLALPLSLVVVCGEPVPSGGGKVDVVELRSRLIDPKDPEPTFSIAASWLAERPFVSEQTRFALGAAMDVVTQLLTMSPIWTATGT